MCVCVSRVRANVCVSVLLFSGYVKTEVNIKEVVLSILMFLEGSIFMLGRITTVKRIRALS